MDMVEAFGQKQLLNFASVSTLLTKIMAYHLEWTFTPNHCSKTSSKLDSAIKSSVIPNK